MSTGLHYQYFEVLTRFVPQSDPSALEVGRRFAFIPSGDALQLMCWGRSGLLLISRDEATTFGAIKQLTQSEKRKANQYIKRREEASTAAILASNSAEEVRNTAKSEPDLRAFVGSLAGQPPYELLGSALEGWLASRRDELPALEAEAERTHRQRRLIDNERFDNGVEFSDLIAIVDYCRRQKPALLQVSA